jgi:hypothetical protein
LVVNIADLEWTAEGVLIHIRRSKTDQEGRCFACCRKPNLKLFQFGGENCGAPDDGALGLARVVLAAQIGQMRGNYIPAAADPPAALIDAGQQLATVGDPAPTVLLVTTPRAVSRCYVGGSFHAFPDLFFGRFSHPKAWVQTMASLKICHFP